MRRASGVQAASADISDLTARAAHLRSAVFQGARLDRADLSYADLSLADLSNASLENAELFPRTCTGTRSDCEFGFCHDSYCCYGGVCQYPTSLLRVTSASTNVQGAYFEQVELCSRVSTDFVGTYNGNASFIACNDTNLCQ